MSKYNFNVTGAYRKTLAVTISEILGETQKYLGMPSAAYKIGEYTLSKTGVLEGPDNPSLIAWLAQRGFEPETFATTDSDDSVPDIDQHHPGKYAKTETTEEMIRLAERWMEGQPEPDQNTLTIQVPRDGFTPEKMDNLVRLVESKAPLLKKALGTEELPIRLANDTIDFPWFRLEGIDGEADAYGKFISALCDTAKAKTRVTAKAQVAYENESYALRVWLLGLGLIGPSYALARKLLGRKMNGNSSWRYGKPEAPATK